MIITKSNFPFAAVRRLWSLVPVGGSLPEDVWRTRHQFLLGLTWFHAVVIALMGPVLGYNWELSLEALFDDGTVIHTVGEGLIVAFFAALAGWSKTSRTFRATIVGVGLMSSSAILVHFSGGYIELHFHFFVMIIFLALYQDWVPFGAAILYVAIHHGVVGVLWSEEVYNHSAALNAPWTWASIHAFFVLWASVGSIIAWRFNEKAIAQTKLILDSAGEGICGLDREGKITFINNAAAKMLRLDARDVVGNPMDRILTHTNGDGTHFPAGLSPILAPLEDGTAHQAAGEIFRRQDGTSFPVDYASTPTIERGELTGLVINFRDVTERKRAEEQIHRSLERIRALREIDHAVSSTLELQSTLDLLLQKMDPFFPDSLLIIRLVNKTNDTLELAAWHNITKDELRDAVGLSTWGLAGVVFKSRQLLAITNLQRDPRSLNPESFLKYGVQSYLGVPLIAKDRALGTLSILSKESHEFSPEEIEFVSMLAGHAAIAIHNAQLHTKLVKLASDLAKSNQELKKRAEELGALNSVAIKAGRTLDVREILEIALDRALALTNRELGYIRLKDPVTGELTLAAHRGIPEDYIETLLHSRTPGGKSDQVFASGQSLIVNNPTEIDLRKGRRFGVQATAWIPMKARGRTVGIMSISTTGLLPFTLREVSLLEAIGSMTGNAWENARLLQEAEVRAKEISGLYDEIKKQAGEMEKSNAELARREKVQSFLKELSLDITSIDAKQLLKKLTEKVRDFFQTDACSVRVKDSGGWRLMGLSGTNVENLRRDLVDLQLGRRARWIIENRKPLVVPDMTQSENFSSTGTGLLTEFRSYVGVPLLSRAGEVIGVLRLLTYQPKTFSPEEVELLQQLANGAALALENGRLLEETREQAEEHAALSAVAIEAGRTLDVREILKVALDKILELTNRERGYIRLKDPVTGELTLAAHHGVSETYRQTLLHGRVPGGKTDRVFESGQSLVVNDPKKNTLKKETLQEGIRSLACVPIKAHGKVIGILNVAGSEPGSFTAREVHLLEAIGSVIGNAWENACLFQEAEVRAKEIAALYDVSTTVNQSLDLDPVLQEVLRKIMDIFHFDAARVYLLRPEAGELHLRSALDMRSESLARTRVFRPGQGNIGKAFQSGEPVIFSDVRESVEYKTNSLSRVMQSSGFNFFAAFPIRTRLKPVGVLSCIGGAPRHLTPAEIRLLNLMTDQIGIAADHARLYEETKKQAGELEKTNTELRRSNKVKDEFLGVMSHELRTPLSAVMGYAAMLQDGGLGEIESQQASALRVIENQTKDLLDMINSILEATKIEAGATVTQSQPTDLKPFLDEIRSTYDISLKKDVSLIWDYDGDLPRIATDPAKLKHILQNLINNAIKFTHEGQVALSARYLPQRHQVELRVSDTGVGIPPEMQSAIFERFRQVDSSDTRLYGGVGLGLYIAKSFTEMLGGALAVSSEVEKGSTFTVNLPCEKAPSEVSNHQPSAFNGHSWGSA